MFSGMICGRSLRNVATVARVHGRPRGRQALVDVIHPIVLGTAGDFLKCSVGVLVVCRRQRRIAERRLLEPRSERLRTKRWLALRSFLEGSFTIEIKTVYKYRKPCEMRASG